MDGERGRGVGVGLPLLRDDLEIRLSQVGGVFSEPLNSNANGPCPVESSGSCTKACPASPIPKSPSNLESDVRPTVLVPPLKLLEDVRGLPREVRFRSLEVGAEAVWGGTDDRVGMVERGRKSSKPALDMVLLLFDVGLVAAECCGRPKAKPTAATPTVPVAHSC